ncbi:hypothetical protein BDV95DRAFT_224053 [Massariosphaeria phaeospora]|uniref:Uncharacterized protein n=1 Tax=Massariosphaeria phaeospora TaxID=100035 RepID=A0A7C8ICU9_9PLEO|nr:hypothetical protein BDV95DRAFT_224053 [Massariosphaeria phaeospora]
MNAEEDTPTRTEAHDGVPRGDEVTEEDDAVSKENGISAEDEVSGQDGTSEEYTPSYGDDAIGEDEATTEYEPTREHEPTRDHEPTREHEGIGRGAGDVAALQHISRSLERIEQLLVSQNSGTKRLRKVMVKQTGGDSGNDSSHRSSSRHSRGSGTSSSSTYDDSVIVEPRCLVDEIPGYDIMVGRGRYIPQCNQLDLLFTESALQRHEPSGATMLCELLDRYITAVEHSGHVPNSL